MKHHYEIAKEAFAILQFYGDAHASSQLYLEELNKVIDMLKSKAESYPADNMRAKKFLLAFADALAHENKPGEYKSTF
jgi:hypothetical protein